MCVCGGGGGGGGHASMNNTLRSIRELCWNNRQKSLDQ